MLPSEPADRELGIRIDNAANGNRWAAFTDDELHSLNDSVFIADQHERERTGEQMGSVPAGLSVELQAELEARAAQRTEPA